MPWSVTVPGEAIARRVASSTERYGSTPVRAWSASRSGSLRFLPTTTPRSDMARTVWRWMELGTLSPSHDHAFRWLFLFSTVPVMPPSPRWVALEAVAPAESSAHGCSVSETNKQSRSFQELPGTNQTSTRHRPVCGVLNTFVKTWIPAPAGATSSSRGSIKAVSRDKSKRRPQAHHLLGRE
jgi:hypothetical protein